MQTATITRSRPFFWTYLLLAPGYSLRSIIGYACACEEGGMAMGIARGLGPTPWPPSYEEGGMAMGIARDCARGVWIFMA